MESIAQAQRTSKLVVNDIAHHLHPVTNLRQHLKTGPLIIERGEGAHLWDTEGKEYLDGFAGLWNVNVGYGRRELAEAARDQMERLAYSPTFYGLSTPPTIELAAKLAEMLPGPLNHVNFTSGGAESNETALKIARYYWSIGGRPEKVKIISRLMGYHGIAMGALAATGIPAYWQHFGPRTPGFIHLSAPYDYRNNPGLSEDEFVARLVAELEETIAREGADTIAAFIGEPVQGAGGVVVPPAGYWKAIAPVLKEHEILLIADEVITGFGRTGAMFGMQQYDFQPDIASLAKGITSGYIPLGGVSISDEIFSRIAEPDQLFYHGFTYSGHPTACAVALRNIAIIEDEHLVANAQARGEQLLGGLTRLLDHPHVGNVRGKGLMAYAELVADKDSKAKYDPSFNLGGKIQQATRGRGLIVRASNDGVAVAPPLVISEAEVDELLTKLEEAIREVCA
ncbi:MAG TPA: aspartate aminotransferase family protein [Thermomicrobiales bacterium]|nr:aspartate aminotransferase family protein [Thermomicrobiales bacterium]